MKSISPITTNAWKELRIHFNKMKNIHLVDLFKYNHNRFKNFSYVFKSNMLIDFSKNRITDETIQILLRLSEEMQLSQSIQDMFNGKHINVTENRPVLHTALRNFSHEPILVNNIDIMPKIRAVLNKMKHFSKSIISGVWRGYSGKKITHVVNIGIGGSDLGPRMVTEALKPYKNHLKISYVSNIDSTDVYSILKNCDFSSTIFLVSSKNFTTEETITNATTIKNYFLKKYCNLKDMKHHFFAVTANVQEALKFGIEQNNIFELWDWVGGRYSLWSAMGLSIMLSIGFNNFCNFLHGAYDMDIHFKHASFEKNIPVLLSLIGIWYNNFFNTQTEAILPYDQYLYRFPSYIQQCNMESNGKNIDRNGDKVCWQTGSITWGEVGTNGQHSFYQLIHQGTKLIPCDFIASTISHNPIENHHKILLSNFFAQTHALAFGKYFNNNGENTSCDHDVNHFSEKFKYFEGNRPSNSILFKIIDPYSLGSLIALYEHKIFVQGVILNIFSFDQWGVELGKVISNNIFQGLHGGKNYKNDVSTQGLIHFYNTFKNSMN
ncbi:glucose-6-phosphate isomerase [Buchnera aphidicola]|uniref:glucose-6-phosphate isomerase n=1 Tax=Buchnera aphidicola TaxID=9 RepID=UPI00346477EF